MDPGWHAAAGKGQNFRLRMGVSEEAREVDKSTRAPEQVLSLRNPQTEMPQKTPG